MYIYMNCNFKHKDNLVLQASIICTRKKMQRDSEKGNKGLVYDRESYRQQYVTKRFKKFT